MKTMLQSLLTQLIDFVQPGRDLGFRAKKRGPSSTRTIEDLSKECVSRDFPYTLCLYHRKVVNYSQYTHTNDDWQNDDCNACNPLLDYIEVSDEYDLQLAMANLEA
jgi:hypothetical protein